MFEIECPTCEKKFGVPDKVREGYRIECPQCGELLRVVSVDPFEIEYWDEEEEEEEQDFEALEELEEEDLGHTMYPDDEENENFEPPERSTLFDNIEEENEKREGEES